MLHPPIDPPPTLQPGGDLQLFHVQLIVPRQAIVGCSSTLYLACPVHRLMRITPGEKGFIVTADRRQRWNTAGTPAPCSFSDENPSGDSVRHVATSSRC